MNVQNFEVRTPLGKGWIVHIFPDCSYAIEYQFGGGEIRLPNDPDVYIVQRVQCINGVRQDREMVA